MFASKVSNYIPSSGKPSELLFSFIERLLSSGVSIGAVSCAHRALGKAEAGEVQ